MTLSRRQLLVRGGAIAGAALLPTAPPAFGAANLRKMIDIGPGGVIHPGTAQDYRAYSNRTYFADTQTGWIRMWADWPSLQPDGRFRVDDPASPGYANLQALDAQIRQACADGLYVMLMPYRHPLWANGTAGLVRDSDAEISLAPGDRMSSAAWNKYVAKGRSAAAYNPSRRALEYRIPDEGYVLDGAWSRFFEFLMRRYHWGQRASGRYVGAFELVNEPNLQLWPQRAPSTSADPFDATSPLTIGPTVAQLLRTAQAVSARVGHTTGMYAPSSSDSEAARAWSRTTSTSRPTCSTRSRRSATGRTPRRAGRTTTTPTSRRARRRGCSCCGTGSGVAGPAGRSRARRRCGSPRAARGWRR